ncbi:MAG TPA: PAS domain S-box protein, partial [Actinomycetota bacterium]|nr:PAS domain S-box protein [Actinomycetota bacterium]
LPMRQTTERDPEDGTGRHRGQRAARPAEDVVQRFYATFDDAPVALYRTTPAGQLLNANRALVELLGHPDRASLMSSNMSELYVDRDDRRRWKEMVARDDALKGHEWRLRRRDGSMIWVRDTARAVRDEDGHIRFYDGAIVDVTERRLAEQALRESEARYRRLVERLPAIVYSAELDESGRWRYVSPQIESMLGFAAETWVRENLWRERLHPADRDRVLAEEARSRDRGEAFSSEYRLLARDGREVWVRDEATVHRPGRDGRALLEGLIHDITPQKLAAAALADRNAELEALHEMTVGLIRELDPTEVLRMLVSRAAMLLGTEHGYVYTVDDAGGADEMVCGVGIGLFESVVGVRLRRGEGVAGRVWDRAQPLSIEDYSSWDGRSQAFDHLEIGAVVGVPLLSGDTVVGVLGVVRLDERRGFSADDLELLQRFARFGSLALHNARLYTALRNELSGRERVEGSLRRRNRELAALSETTAGLIAGLDPERVLRAVVERATELMGTKHGWLSVLDEERGEIEVRVGQGVFAGWVGQRQQRGVGLDGEVWDQQRSITVEDYATWRHRMRQFDRSAIGPVAAVPLRARSDMAGVIGVGRLEKERTFTVEELELLERLAYVASLALHGARLYRRLELELSERRRAEAVLLEREQQLNEAEAVAHIGSWTWEVGADRVVWSRELYDIFGVDAERYRPTYDGFVDLVHPDDRDAVAIDIARALDEGGSFARDHRIVRPDGSERWLHGRGDVIVGEEGEPVRMRGTAQDITERKLAEEARRKSEELFRELLESAPDAVVIIDADGRIVLVNAQTEALFGYDRGEIVGRDVEVLVPERLRDGHPRHRGRYAADPKTRPMGTGLELLGRRRDGTEFPVDITLSGLTTDGETTVMAIVRDVTDQRKAQEALREAYEREREAAERLRMIDEMKNSFLEAVSHDLRTPLTSVLGYAVTLQRPDLDVPDEQRREMLDLLVANARKLERLLSDLLDLDRLLRGVVEPHRRPTDLADLLRHVIAEADVQGRPLEIVAEPVVLAVDPAKIERIIENLLVNAVRHTPEGTRLWVRISAMRGGALIAVEDEGRGVPASEREEIFDPFRRGSRSPAHAPGSGIGLSLVGRFTELHGGRAWVEDRPGGGASFKVFLPAV